MIDYMRELIAKRRSGELCGMPSYCTANPVVIEACMCLHKTLNVPILIEATANQVNQFGGYTGMKPADFRDMVWSIAQKIGFPREKIILGGDHLGPLTWSDLPEDEAMKNARDLVYSYVKAGFRKLHLDTSMKLKDDDPSVPLLDEVIARRGADLYAVCEAALCELHASDTASGHPTYIIGSEVPIPGGARETGEGISVTKPEALANTIDAYRNAFGATGQDGAFENIIGIVVQPGVEFGDDSFFEYNSTNAAALTHEARKHRSIVLEGHSTDYQSVLALKEMVRDGIAILKVGPALTFAYREALFALSMMERELISESRRACFIETLEQAMLLDPSNWKKHYHGNEERLRLCRKYSYSDRARYYLAVPEVDASVKKLFENMGSVSIPLNMLHQYLPLQYDAVIRGELKNEAFLLVLDHIKDAARPYCFASGMM